MPGSAHSEDSRNSLITKIANLHISIQVTQVTQITPPSELSRAPPLLLWWWCCCCWSCCCRSYWCIPFLASISTGPIEILLSTSISFASPSDERERERDLSTLHFRWIPSLCPRMEDSSHMASAPFPFLECSHGNRDFETNRKKI